MVGRYKKAGTAKIVVTGKVGDKEQRFDFPAAFVEQSNDESLAFIEKLWAVRRVGEILDQMDLNGKNDELVKELVELATRHGILTPYTSFMADETTNIHDVASNFDRANRRLESLAQTGGAAGTAQRAMKGDFQNAYNYRDANDFSGNAQAASKKLASNGFNRFAQSAPAVPAARAMQAKDGGGGMGGGGYAPARWPRLPKRPRRPVNCPTAAKSSKRPARRKSRSATSAIAPSIAARTSGSIPR